MRLRHGWLMLLLSLTACQLVPHSKSSKAKKTAAPTKPLASIVLISPELVGQECVVEERGEDEKKSTSYTGQLLKFDNEIVELKTPAVETHVTRDKKLMGVIKRSSASGRDQMEENKSIPRDKIASIRAVTAASADTDESSK